MLWSWIKAFHVISMVTWFAGLFYLPRLFVYHADSNDVISKERFKIMERRLYYYITTPGALCTILFGLIMLLSRHAFYATMMWLHIKLALVFLLCVFHICCAKYLRDFATDNNRRSATFYRVLNEVPTVFLIAIIILSIVQPWS